MSEFTALCPDKPILHNCLLIDWFSLTVRFDPEQYDNSADFVYHFCQSVLGLSWFGLDWLSLDGFHGFADRIYYNGISIHYNGKDNMGLSDRIWVEMSGQGCRAFEEYSKNPDWLALFDLCLSYPSDYHLTRLDIAYDDFDNTLDLDLMDHELSDHNCVTTFKDCSVERSYFKDDMCIYFGSKNSDIMFRCYNKAAERNREDEIDHWVRFEIQLRDDRALTFVRSYVDDKSLGRCFSGIIDKCFRFVIPSETDSNKRRWDTQFWWFDFIGTTAAIPDFTRKDTDYNMMRLEKYVTQTAGAAIDTYIQCVGLEKFMKQVKKQAAKKINIKYEKVKQSSKLADDIWSSSHDLTEVFQKLNAAGLV